MSHSVEQEVPQLNQCPCINVSFALSGKQLPADHGYLLYSAISKAAASLHGVDWLAIELISGFPSRPGFITLPERDATLRLRIPADHYRDVLRLAGKRLDIAGRQIRLGLPVARPLDPAASLYARIVTIKKFTEADPFLGAVRRQLDSLEVTGRAELPRDKQGRYRRRIVTIHGKSVVGSPSLRVGGLFQNARLLAVHNLSLSGSTPNSYLCGTESPVGISEINS